MPPLARFFPFFFLSRGVNACHQTSKLSFFSQDAEGDEEEDDDPDYQPPPVSQKFPLIHTLHTDLDNFSNIGFFRKEIV